jgi:hypothetical protein
MCARTRPPGQWSDPHKMGAFGEEREAEWTAWVKIYAQEKANATLEDLEAERRAAAEDLETELRAAASWRRLSHEVAHKLTGHCRESNFE